MRPAVFTWPAADADGICLSQTTAGAGALTINGALLDLALTTYRIANATMGAGIERVVTITAGADESAVNFTVTGTDLRGAAVSETIAGPDTDTVATTAVFHTVTSVTADAAVANAVTVGSGEAGDTTWFTCDDFANPNSITVGISQVTGTVSVTVQNTLDDVQTNDSPTTFDHPTLATLTAAAESNYAFPPRCVRALNASGDGAFTFTVIQSGG